MEQHNLEEILIQTRDMAYDFVKKTDAINKRLIIAIVFIVVSLSAVMGYFTWQYFSCTYIVEQIRIEGADTNEKNN